jgi:hypothetical protein
MKVEISYSLDKRKPVLKLVAENESDNMNLVLLSAFEDIWITLEMEEDD